MDRFIEHFGDPKAAAQQKAAELNRLAGSSRFVVKATTMPNGDNLRGSYSIIDKVTGKSYVYGSIAGMAGLAALTNELRRKGADATSSASPGTSGKMRRRNTSFRHEDVDGALAAIESENINDVNHYGVLGMKWGVRRTPEQLGHRPKYSKGDNARRKDLVRGVTAAQKNFTDKAILSAKAEKDLIDAKAENVAAHQMVVLPWNRAKKRARIAETERYVADAMKALEIPRAERNRAEKFAMEQTKKLKEFQDYVNNKYGKENIKQLKEASAQINAYDEGVQFVATFVKTGVNMANFPVIGNWVAANYITAWEDAERERLSKERATNIEKNRY